MVLMILCKLNWSKVTSLDVLSPRIVKGGAALIVYLVTDILSLSVKCGELPDDIKVAKGTPIHKKYSKLDAGNYWPVSVLSTTSKLFESTVYNQLDDHHGAHKLFYEYESSFRSPTLPIPVWQISQIMSNGEWDVVVNTGFMYSSTFVLHKFLSLLFTWFVSKDDSGNERWHFLCLPDILMLVMCSTVFMYMLCMSHLIMNKSNEKWKLHWCGMEPNKYRVTSNILLWSDQWHRVEHCVEMYTVSKPDMGMNCVAVMKILYISSK